MTHADVHNIASNAIPAAGVKERLAQALDAAQRLHVDAEWLAIETDSLFADLRSISNDPAASGNAAIDAALDAASWVSSAASNAQAELSTLIDHLYDAIEA